MIRALAIAGIVGGVIWICLPFFSPEWGPPGSQDYLGYELWNRIWTPALVGMMLGFLDFYRVIRVDLPSVARVAWIILLVGFGMMVAGNVAEFWVFTAVPYNGGGGPNIRDLSWMTFLLGFVLAHLGAMTAGLASLSGGGLPRWLAIAFAGCLPVMVGAAYAGLSWAGIPLGFLSVVAGHLLSGGASGRSRSADPLKSG